MNDKIVLIIDGKEKELPLPNYGKISITIKNSKIVDSEISAKTKYK